MRKKIGKPQTPQYDPTPSQSNNFTRDYCDRMADYLNSSTNKFHNPKLEAQTTMI